MKAALMALCLAAAIPAHAEFMDGNTLLSKMQGDVADRAVALGYIEGVFDVLRGNTHCPPAVNNITAGQINDMVYQHLINTPSLRHYTADIIVGHVLKTAWPCRKGTGT